MFEKQKKVTWGVWKVSLGNARPRTLDSPAQKGKLQGPQQGATKEISAGKPTLSQMSRWQPSRFPDMGSELTCSSSASRRNLSKGSQCPVPTGNSTSLKESRKGRCMGVGKLSKGSALLPTPKSPCYIYITWQHYRPWTNERPVILPTYRVQNQHLWVKCL